MTFLVGIAGGSGSGKTTLAAALAEGFPANEVQVVTLDAYYRDLRGVPQAERVAINYDHPSAFDQPLLIEHLHTLKAGNPIQRPVYDYARHERADETVELHPARVVILEGILSLSFPGVLPLLDVKIFVDTAADLRVLRRLRRDLIERGRSIDSVIEQYVETVRPMHDEFVEPTRYSADLIVPAGKDNAHAITMLRAWVRGLVREME
jgi:uridine kinase